MGHPDYIISNFMENSIGIKKRYELDPDITLTSSSDLLSSAQLNGSFNHLKTRNPKMGTSAISEDPDEMPHNAAFHQGLHCLLRQNQSS